MPKKVEDQKKDWQFKGVIKAAPLVKLLEHCLFYPHAKFGEVPLCTYSKDDLKELTNLYQMIEKEYDNFIRSIISCRIQKVKKKSKSPKKKK